MKNAKRCLAILLAVTLLCSNGVSQLGTIVSASELETTEEAQPKEDAVVEQAEETKEDTGKATVEGVTPEEERGESSAQDAETANVPKAAAQEGQNEANVPEAAPATVAPTTVAPTTATPATVTPATAVPASEGAGQQGEATAPEVQTYNVKINKSELDGGQIKAWGSDNNKVDVTEYDGNNQYVKEVKEGEEFNFQITLNDGFEIAQVKVNGNAFDPANTEGNVITYKVAGINEEKVIDVTYNKIETPAEEKAAEEPKTEDETKVEEPAVAEPEDNSISTASLNENISTVADSEKTIKVGETASLKSSDYKSSKYSHKWSITSGNDVIKLTGSGYKVTAEGLKEGTATVSDWIYRYSLYHTTITYTVRVTSSEKVTVKPAIVYYLKDPTKDANSNDTGHWGDAYGNATVNVEGAKWVKDKNCFNGLSQRVVSWPNNTNVIPNNSTHWNAIFNDYKASIQTQLGVKITADDVEEITLVPAKISKNNGTNPDLHLDCNVNIKCKSVALVKYYLFDANGTNWEMLGSKNYIVKDTSTTKPDDVTSRTFPETKTVNGVTYKFSGWYTDENLTQRAPEFPAKVTGSVNYYAKYTAEYKVSYNLAGGKFSDDSTSAEEKHNADTTVTVKEEPTRAGCKFIGWTVEGLGTTTTLDSGETFTMPNRDVTLTAKWEEQKIEEFLTLVPKDVSKPYDGTELQAGTAKVTGKVEGADTAGVKIEYSLNGRDWTTNPSEITATNVSDSKTVQVRATSEKYTGELTGTEELTITPKPVTVTANSYNKAYGATDPEFTATVEGTLGSDTVNYKLNRETGEDVGTYKILAIGDAAQGNYSVTYHSGTLTITAATRPEDRQLGVTSYEGVYDANEHTITVDNVLDGDVVEYSYDGGETWTTNLNQYKDVTETTIKVRVTNANYDPSLVELEGTVKITPKPVTVTANSDSKTYGAVDPEFTATVVGTLGTDKVTYSLSREAGEDVGEYLITASGDVAQGNYSVSYNPGTLTIVASDREKAVEVASYNGVYDAKKHTIEVKNLERGDLVKYSYDNGTTWEDELKEYTDVTAGTTILVQVMNDNYAEVPKLTGTVTITPKPVTVTANSDSKTYGAADPEFTVTVVGTLGTDKVTYNLSREAGEGVGTYPITASGDAIQGNYNVTYHPGTLTITAATRPEDRQLSVTSYEGVYDANEHTITVDNVLDGDVVEYSYDGGETWTTNLNQYKDVTETTIKVRVTNANYDPNLVELEGTVKITPKPVTVTANSYNKAYGATDPTFTAKVEGTLGTDAVNYILNRETGENVGTYKILAIGDATQGNYSVTYYPGTLTITAATRPEDKQLSVTSYEGVYDANEHTITVDNVLDGDVVEYSYDGGETWTTNLNQYKDVTETTIKVRVTNANYDPNPVELEGTVKITPKPVTVTANSYNKAYGATDPEFTATVEGTLGSDTVNYKLNRETGEDVGTYKILAIGDAAQGNYSVTYHSGTLTITAATRPEDRQLGVTSYEGVYDANEHTITVDNVLDGDVVEYSYDGGETWTTNLNQYKDVTETTIKVRVTNANYDPSPVELEGTVKITPATLTVSTPIATKVYEGTPLTAAGTISGFVNDETATFATTGSQTEVGSTANTYSLTWDGTAKESNYKVVETIGTLTVTAQSIDPDNPNYKGITVDAPTDVEYTGEDQTWLPTVTDGNGKALVKDTDYTVTYDNEDRTNVTGIITVTINGAGNYAGTITRTYQITPKPVTITTESKTRAFDGTALTAGGKVEGIVSGETYGFKTTGSQTYVGSSQNTYEMVWADSEVEGTSGTYTAKKTNYTVTESIGTLVVTAGTPENPLDPTLVVNKTHDKSQTYKAGDVITFTITAKNIYEETKTITLEELEGVALDANVFENVAPGAEVTATATYTVTEQDIVNGTFTNNVTVTFSGVDDKFTGTDTVDELEDANPHMTITKTTVGAEEGHIYKLNDVINYKITATNDGNLTLTNVKVEDALTGNVGENAFTIDILAPGEAQTFDVRYVVTENDVLEGKVINNATGTATDPTDPDEPKTPVTPGEKEDPIETPNPSLAVVKTSDKTGVVKLGETITYTITVTNNGNVTINDIEVTDELTGNTGDNAFTIDRLAVGETKQFTATYTVTEDDILEGTIVNRATATGKDPRNEEVTGEGEVRVDTEEKDDSKKDDSKKNDSDKKPGAVKTGDATDVIPFFGMTVLAAGAAIVIALKKKRRA